MIRASTKTTDNGKDKQRKLIEVIKRAKDSYVTIGVHEGAGTYPGEGVEVYQVALWNEFGTEHMPSRSFIRSAIDDNEGKINAWRDEMVENILDKGWTVQKALETIGFRIQVLIQNKIKSNVPPPNAPSTQAAKTREGIGQHTLIDTGLMLRSITYKVVA